MQIAQLLQLARPRRSVRAGARATAEVLTSRRANVGHRRSADVGGWREGSANRRQTQFVAADVLRSEAQYDRRGFVRCTRNVATLRAVDKRCRARRGAIAGKATS